MPHAQSSDHSRVESQANRKSRLIRINQKHIVTFCSKDLRALLFDPHGGFFDGPRILLRIYSRSPLADYGTG
jgi:hypothetical protein